MKEHLNIKIFGLVQGIFFRASAKQQADKFGITGFARNEFDGSVYIFLKWCRQGPALAEVEKVTATEDSPKNFKEFKVY